MVIVMDVKNLLRISNPRPIKLALMYSERT